MAKFKVLEKQGQIGIRCKLTGNEQINSGEILYFSQNFIKGFMQPSVEDAGKLIFIGAQGVPLSRFLKQVITKEQFFPIVAQVIEIYKAAVNRNLPLQNVVLSPDFIVINPNTGEMSFVYAAITTPQPMNDGYTSCMNRIASIAHFATQEDLNAVGNFLNFINGLGSFSVPEMESYIMKAAPITYNIVIRQPFNPPAAQPAPAAAPQTAPAAPVQEAAPAAPVQETKPESAPVQETKPEPVKEEEKPAVQSAPAVQIPQPAPVEAPPVIHADEAKVKEIKAPEVPAAPEDKASEPVHEVKQPEPEAKKPEPVQEVKQPEPEVKKPEPVQEVKQPEPEVKKPEPVKESTPAEQPAPKLTRRSNGETFSVNKPVFKLGKERAKVDFCITGNKTVSRVHATLYVRGGECFVQDNNSTNRTFVNGEPIAVQTEIKLKKGDVLKLSNEEFDFIG